MRESTEELLQELINRGISVYDLKLKYINKALNHFQGNKLRTARMLQINHSHLYFMINRYGWNRKE